MIDNKYDSYLDFPDLFTAELFEPDKWAKLFASAGARFVTIFFYHCYTILLFQ